MSKTSIEWTDYSWNPIRARRRDNGKVGWHCELHHAGCINCYAQLFNQRNLPNGGTGLPYTRSSRDLVEVYVDDDVLRQPLSWKKPRRVFVCSMTDLFGEFVTDGQINRIWNVMATSPQHTFQVLTKRPERAAKWFAENRRGDPIPNLQIGTSPCDQKTADASIPHLLQVPAAVMFLSLEPMLGYTTIYSDIVQTCSVCDGMGITTSPHDGAEEDCDACNGVGNHPPLVKWVIVGCESMGPRTGRLSVGGEGTREGWINCAIDVVKQCDRAGAACFVKQIPGDDGMVLKDISQFPAALQVREFPK